MRAECWRVAHISESPLCSDDMSFGGESGPVKSLILAIAVAQRAQLTVSIPQHTAPGWHDRIVETERRQGDAIPWS